MRARAEFDHGDRVKLNIPEEMRGKRGKYGPWINHHGKLGTVVCPAGNGGTWVRFDGMGEHEYDGVATKYLTHNLEVKV